MADVSNATSVAEWIGFFEREYLTDYVPCGGSTMKLVVTDGSTTRSCLDSAIHSVFTENGIQCVDIDADAVRVDRMEEVFFAVSRAIDWVSATQGVITNLLRDHEGLALEGEPFEDETFLDWVSDQTGRDRRYLQQAVVRLLHDHLWANTALTRDFRRGVWTLAKGISGGRVGEIEAAVIAWLRGELTRLSALRQLQIGSRVNRNNARSFLESTTEFIKMGQGNGLALYISLDPVVSGQPRTVDGRKYTLKATLDTYEVLRHFVDSISDMRSTALIAVAGQEILDLSIRGRGLIRYQALQARLIGDVADARFTNPAAAVAQLKGC